ncbi:MAG: hypothetical protein KIT22_00080 [Verrucomicrobiae bacterium]|nr:hypothetical protein [Verrucomicrobiae bacterium]
MKHASEKRSARVSAAAWISLLFVWTACSPKSDTSAPAEVAEGTIEVTARLLEIPEGAIFKRDLYDYATILKYEVTTVHRGKVEGPILFVGHYNPFKSRKDAADAHVQALGETSGSSRQANINGWFWSSP